MSVVEEMLPEFCRVCLKCSQQSRCLLIKSKHNKGIIRMLSSLMKTELVLDPEWPSSLCKTCEEELVTAYNFIEKCHATNLKITDCKSRGNVKLEREDTIDVSDEWDKSSEVLATIAKTESSNVEPISDDNDLSLDAFESEVADDDQTTNCAEPDIPFELVKIESKTTTCDLASNENNKASEGQVVTNKKAITKCEKRDSMRTSTRKKATKTAKEKVESEEPGFCEKCNRNTSNIKKHKYMFHESATARILEECEKGDNPTCKVCGKKFKNNTTLRSHIRLVHTDETPYKCHFCGRSTQSSTGLIEHERLHTGEKAFICQYCGKGYPNKINLKSHLVQHTGKKHFCELCGKAFARNYFLKLHMKRHTGEFRYLCTHCGKKFIATGAYKEHLRTHTNERPYKCEQCGQAFKTRKAWRRHLGIHTGYKPLPCRLCPYSCTDPYRMRQHMKTHGKELDKTENSDNISAEMPSQ